MHEPVLLSEVLEYLSPRAGESYLDVTAGLGGHAERVLELTRAPKEAVLVDTDQQSAAELTKKFGKAGTEIISEDFLVVSRRLNEEDRKFDLIFADLGVSSPQLDEASRGFSFNKNGPLDMRMNETKDLTADKIVNGYSEKKLAEILRNFGQEPKALEIARRIVDSRPVNTTSELAKIAQKSWPSRSRVHPATRTFQALRIAVNSELEQLQQSLPVWLDLLKPEGRMVIISFHSLEDRIVKDFLAENSAGAYDAELRLLTKKPITASPNEIVSNPRARSAKLRAAAKIKTKRKD